MAAALGVPPRRMLPDWRATGVGIDSRTLNSGDVFVCVRGERTDGHEYIAQALAAGAAGLVVEEQAALVQDLGLPHPADPGGVAVFLVEDGLIALQALARYHRQRMSGQVFGVTGSNGKTSAKEMLAGMLEILTGDDETSPVDSAGVAASNSSRVAATMGNLNNHFGVPLTLLSMPADVAYAVVEMGMNHAGEIELLSRIARPHQALITSIAPVHIENFADLDGIARAKLEILAGLEPGGTLVFPEAAHGRELAEAAARQHGAKLALFSVGAPGAPGDVGASDASDVAGAGLSFDWRGRTVHAPAYHNPVMASNLTAVLELLLAAGFEADALVAAAARIAPSTGRRFEIIRKPRRPGDQASPSAGAPQLLVDDSYNANPTSFARAAEALRALLPEGRLACFAGEMGELGPEYGPAGHREVGAVLARQAYEFVGVCGGKNAEALKDSFIKTAADRAVSASAHATVQDLLAEAGETGLAELARFDGVLVKGSRSARMDLLCDALRETPYA